MQATIRRLWLAGLVALLLAAAGDRRRIAYLPVPIDDAVLPHRPPPRIAYPRIPRDDRLADDPSRWDARGDRPRPAIWRIDDADTTIYLFGTIDALPPGFAWRGAGVDRIVAEADTLILESTERRYGVAGLLPRAPEGPAMPPLKWRVSTDHRAKLAALMGSLPREAASVLSGLPTWLAAVAVGIVRDDRGETIGPGAVDWLRAVFERGGRRVEGIEDGARVMTGTNSVPEREQQRMLDAALDAPPSGRADGRAARHAWARGDVGPGSALALDVARSGGSATLTRRLLTDRNRAWAERLQQKLATPGTMLFAGGAGHFVGPDSVLDWLARSGVAVTRVQ